MRQMGSGEVDDDFGIAEVACSLTCFCEDCLENLFIQDGVVNFSDDPRQ